MGTLARAQDTRAQRALPSVPRLEPLANPLVPDCNKINWSEILVNLRCLVTRARKQMPRTRQSSAADGREGSCHAVKTINPL